MPPGFGTGEQEEAYEGLVVKGVYSHLEASVGPLDDSVKEEVLDYLRQVAEGKIFSRPAVDAQTGCTLALAVHLRKALLLSVAR